MGSIARGFRNAFRAKARAAAVIALLAIIMGAVAVLVQVAAVSRQQIAAMEARVRTLIELREAGAFGTGGFGRDKPVGEEAFTTDTLDAARRIPSARHIARLEEYANAPEIDPAKANAYAMVIGLRPGSALRAIGEIDYEHALIVAGRSFQPEDADRWVAVAGRLYAQQRLGFNRIADPRLTGRSVKLKDGEFQLIGIYSTGNDFGDNHVFVPLEAFRKIYRPGKKLSKIFVTVDSVANVERVVAELKTLPEADVVTTPEAVSTARTTLGGLAAASVYAVTLLLVVGTVLVVFVMVLSARERVREIGTLKAIGASNREIALQFVAEASTLCAVSAIGAAVVAALSVELLGGLMGGSAALDGRIVLYIAIGAMAFAAIGSLYPILKARSLSPVEAMRSQE